MSAALLPLALAFIMLVLGLGLTADDFRRVLRIPRAFITGAVCQLLLLPLIAFCLVLAVPITPMLSLGVMLLAFCPGGVTSNMMTRLAGGNVALSVSLTGVVSLISVLTLPVFVSVSAGFFLEDAAPEVSASSLGVIMALITVFPVVLGVGVRALVPRVASAWEPKLLVVATVVFLLIVVGSVVSNWTLFTDNVARLGPLLIGLNIVLFATGMLAGRLMSLPRGDRISIAIETGIQNSAMGVTIGGIIMSQMSGIPEVSLPAGVYGITFYAVAAPFILWMRRGQGG